MLRHILHPIVLMRSAPKSRGMRLAPVEDLAAAPIPGALQDELRRGAAVLVSMGFRQPMYATATPTSPTIDNCVALFEHPADGAIGVTIVAVPKRRPFSPSRTHFTTRFRDGWKIVTSNSPVELRTPPLPRVDGARFLGASLKPLYDMHRARVAERARVTPIAPERRDDPLAFQDREAREIQDYWVAKGIYRHVDGDRMKLTPLGATLAAWRGLFPWTFISALSKDRKARILATRFGIRMSPGM